MGFADTMKDLTEKAAQQGGKTDCVVTERTGTEINTSHVKVSDGALTLADQVPKASLAAAVERMHKKDLGTEGKFKDKGNMTITTCEPGLSK